MNFQNIQPLVLKSGNKTNDQTNDSGPNAKLKSLYNEVKAKWIIQYGTTKFSPHHMNYILVEEWDALKVSAGRIVRYSFSKTKLLPLIHPNLTTNNQTCAESIQVSSGSKTDEIKDISQPTVEPIEVKVTRNDDNMVVLR